jgi:hypothetical protein
MKYGAVRQVAYDPKLDKLMQELMDDLEFGL